MPSRLLYLARHGEQDRPPGGSAAVDPAHTGLSERGRRQARFLAERLRDLPLDAVCHGPLRRAAETAELVVSARPDLPGYASELAGDYLPDDTDPTGLPPAYAEFLSGFSERERTDGPGLAAEAVRRFTSVPAEGDRRELVITHNFLIAWLVRHALAAPPPRWLGLNSHNCGLTAILYRPDRPPTLLAFNDTGHLPWELRGTGLPPELRF
ncbi:MULTISPECIES: histidine phosphatase family protein [Micromonospora]|uniref:Probable phosphoglycerate mutase n=1 Tax=Micromonospora yangpuensis TaxID=683228 RepID=A0A1C6VDJ6_9ACTN|nr:histidine phosphatase family protein [Micromonospora yangpuensis]GGM13952.1 phosphoglycerate mutase [Micromonospora yangpuensis]SCL64439.1 probable phosphoglycerate mutase [Micromonospora yangpuensis]